MKKYTVTFQVTKYEECTPELLESEIKDLLINAVLPALNSELVPLTFTVKAARK
jgi:hypothetical protein